MPPLACKALEMLKSQNTTGAPKVIKDEVIEKMEQLIRWMGDFGKALNKARTVSHRLQCIERDTRETKTWAQQIAAKTQEETRLNQMAKDIEEIKAASNLSKHRNPGNQNRYPSNAEDLRQRRRKYKHRSNPPSWSKHASNASLVPSC